MLKGESELNRKAKLDRRELNRKELSRRGTAG